MQCLMSLSYVRFIHVGYAVYTVRRKVRAVQFFKHVGPAILICASQFRKEPPCGVPRRLDACRDVGSQKGTLKVGKRVGAHGSPQNGIESYRPPDASCQIEDGKPGTPRTEFRNSAKELVQKDSFKGIHSKGFIQRDSVKELTQGAHSKKPIIETADPPLEERNSRR